MKDMKDLPCIQQGYDRPPLAIVRPRDLDLPPELLKLVEKDVRKFEKLMQDELPVEQ